MFENRSQQSKTEVNARIERSQNSSHEQTCFLIKNLAGRIPETTQIVVQNNLYPNLDKIRISKRTLEITKIVDQYNIKRVNIFSVQGCG